MILRDTFSSQGGNGSQRQDAERLFYLADANYNVTGVMKRVDGAWTVAERYLYDAYGNVSYLDGEFVVQTDSDVGNTTLYTGRELDLETGLMYYRARYYHTDLGRFTARDPLEYEAGDLNVYRYVRSSPLSHTDPTGNIIVCGGCGGFAAYYAGASGGVWWCGDHLGTGAIVICGGGGFGGGAAGYGGGAIGTGTLTPGWTGQLVIQGAAGAVHGGVHFAPGNAAQGNVAFHGGVGAGAGAAATIEGCRVWKIV